MSKLLYQIPVEKKESIVDYRIRNETNPLRKSGNKGNHLSENGPKPSPSPPYIYMIPHSLNETIKNISPFPRVSFISHRVTKSDCSPISSRLLYSQVHPTNTSPLHQHPSIQATTLQNSPMTNHPILSQVFYNMRGIPSPQAPTISRSSRKSSVAGKGLQTGCSPPPSPHCDELFQPEDHRLSQSPESSEDVIIVKSANINSDGMKEESDIKFTSLSKAYQSV
jgi:hypothetical protein